METKQYIFAGKKKRILTNDREIQNILDRFQKSKLLNLRIHRFNNKLLRSMDRYDYVSCREPKGYKYLLFLTKFNNEPYALFIYMKKLVIIQDYIQIKDYYDDTLLSGYLVKDNNWKFYIEDMFIENGYDIYKTNFVKRLNKISKMFKNYKPNNMQSCDLELIDYYSMSDFYRICDKKGEFIFRPLDNRNPLIHTSKYYTRFSVNLELNDSIYDTKQEFKKCIEDKDKKTTEVTMNSKLNNLIYNFTIKSHNLIANIYECYSGNDNIGMVRIIKKDILELVKTNINKVFRCQYNVKFDKWEPLGLTSKSVTEYNEIHPELLMKN